MSNHSMNLLFICSENRLRSPTAEAVFAEYDSYNALSAGTNADAETPLSGDLIEWADVILVMEQSHRKKVAKKFKGLIGDKKLACLAIPDNYEYMQPELIELLKAKLPRYLG